MFDIVQQVTGRALSSPQSVSAPQYEARARFTQRKWVELSSNIELEIAKHHEIEQVFALACCYVTGSMARNEALDGSDLDLFIVDELPDDDFGWKPRLTYPEQAHVLSAVDEARRRTDFRAFSQSGRFVAAHSFKVMVQEIGNAEDDFSNRFTARMLLLMNSRPLVNHKSYVAARERVLDSYWRQEPDVTKPFFPVFLINDIKRWWDIVLLNFEFHNPPAAASDNSDVGERLRSNRRINNLKLRYARLLAAWTPILGLLYISGEAGIARREVLPIFDETPMGRLQLLAAAHGRVAEVASDVIRQYDDYLTFMDCSKDELARKVLRDDWSTVIKARSYHFGSTVAELLRNVGEGKPLSRYVQI